MRAPDGTPEAFAVVWSDRYPDDTRVELSHADAELEVGRDAVCVARYDGPDRVVRLEIGTKAATKAPPLWLAELRESTARPPAAHLLAFTGSGVEPGALLDEHQLADVDVATPDQLGAVRWYPATGEVDQIYVAPQWRRRSIGSALIAAGTTLSLARGWPRFWGDGQRTELGEKWRSASPWAHRAAGLTHLAPPMTPGDR